MNYVLKGKIFFYGVVISQAILNKLSIFNKLLFAWDATFRALRRPLLGAKSMLLFFLKICSKGSIVP